MGWLEDEMFNTYMMGSNPQEMAASTPTLPPPTPPTQTGGSSPKLWDTIKEAAGGYFSNPDNWTRMAMGFNSMRYQPDQGLQSALADQLKTSQALKLQSKYSNQTIEWLRKKGVPEEQLAAAGTNPELLKSLVASVLKPEEQFRALTGDQIMKLTGITGLDPQTMYNYSSTGQIKPVSSGGQVFNFGGTMQDAAGKQLVGLIGDTVKAGLDTPALLQALGEIEMLNGQAPDGMIEGAFAEKFRGYDTYGDAYIGLRNKLILDMKKQGTGPMTDQDFLNLVDTLGSLKSSVEARELLHLALRSRLELTQRQGQLAMQIQQEMLYGGNTPDSQAKIRDLQSQMYDVQRMSAVTPDMKAKMEDIVESKGIPVSVSAPDDVWEGMSPDERDKWGRMTENQRQRAISEVRRRMGN